MINTARDNQEGRSTGVDQWAVGLKEVQGMEGTWRDAEDGWLSGNAVAQGSVDSVIALHLNLPAEGQATWTVGATCAGLQAAVNFADTFGEYDLSATYRHAIEEIHSGTENNFWVEDLGRFVRMINRSDDGEWVVDPTIDASLCGLWYFGMFQPDDPRIVATMQAVRDRLWIKTDVGGVARYENDCYHQVSQDTANVPGNPWFICTLWVAQWLIAMAQTADDLKPAVQILNWTADHALLSGVMAEQVNPYTNVPLSVSPLTWSHATLVATVQEYLAKWPELAH